MNRMDSVTIRRPDDFHTHFRDGAMMQAVVPFTTRRFARAIVMPNLSPAPVVTTEQVRAYKGRVEALLRGDRSFTPLMTYYLTDLSSPADLAQGFREKLAYAVKLYPAGATTNSDQGVTDIGKVYPALETMQEIGMPLLVHGETTMKDGAPVAPPDREKVFLDTTLPRLLKDFPGLKIVLEHASTKDAVDFVTGERSPRLASTVTVHHLMLAASDVARSDHPNYLQCMPVVKSEADRAAVRKAATSGEPYFFLGTDSAPHPVSAKEREHPASGIFTAPAALELYAQIFEEEGKLENLESFASMNGATFYGLPLNEGTVTLKKETWAIDSLVQVSNGDTLRPFGYDEEPAKRLPIGWKIA